RLHATISQHGLRSEPARQMFDFLFSLELLTPGDYNSSESSRKFDGRLATHGNLEFDLAVTVMTTLLDQRPMRVPTTTKGPLWSSRQNMGALLVGRLSTGLKGLIIIPGVIDADFSGTVEAVVHTLYPPMQVPKGGRPARLIPLELLATGMVPEINKLPVRGDRGFAPSGKMVCFSYNRAKRPVIKTKMRYWRQEVGFQDLLDTGADVTIIRLQIWPPNWPKYSATSKVGGIGGPPETYKS
ncbi:POK9 protein, partial [Eudromia elegans]|nr:POK9 protein [Eudromia elegans]